MTTIHTEVYGQGPALVLIPGWGMHCGVWREFAKQLAKRYQVICLDLPGHGRSETLLPFTLPAIAETLLQAIPVPKFSLLGWSLGATIVLEMADLCPDRLTSLLMLAGNLRFVKTGDWPGVSPEILAGFSSQLALNPTVTQQRFLALQLNASSPTKRLLQSMKILLGECASPSVDVLLAGLEALKHSDLRPALQKLSCPLTVIQGDSDSLIPLATGFAIRQLKPDINLQVIPAAGHAPFLSHPKQLLDTVFAAL